jgi:RHS repeat-associated protein
MRQSQHILPAFGMGMFGRSSGNEYAFGFNGKREEKEFANGIQDFGARMYDEKLGRFFSADPFEVLAPYKSTYSFAANSPIYKIDYEGLFDIQYSANSKVSKEARILFREIVNNLHFYLQNSPEVLQTISQQTGYSTERILDLVSSRNKEITLRIENRTAFNTGAQVSLNDYQKKQISISDDLIKELTDINIIKDNNYKAALALVTAGTILHEFAHYGDRDNNYGAVTSTGLLPDDNKDCINDGDGYQSCSSSVKHRGVDVENSMYGLDVSLQQLGNRHYIYTKKDIANLITKIKINTNADKALKTFLPNSTKGTTGTVKRATPKFE